MTGVQTCALPILKQLTSFTIDINCFINLIYLSLNNNKFSSKIFEENCSIYSSNIQKINIKYNHITSISWKNCPKNLQEIFLGANPISEILHEHLKPPNVHVYGLPIIIPLNVKKHKNVISLKSQCLKLL